jgi:hypothetical protein
VEAGLIVHEVSQLIAPLGVSQGEGYTSLPQWTLRNGARGVTFCDVLCTQRRWQAELRLTRFD